MDEKNERATYDFQERGNGLLLYTNRFQLSLHSADLSPLQVSKLLVSQNDTIYLSLHRLGSALAEPKGTSDTNKKHPTTAHPPMIRWNDDISYYSPEPVNVPSGSVSGMRDPPKCKA